DARHQWDTQSLQARLRSVADLREERITHDHQPDDLHRSVDPAAKAVSLTSARQRDPCVGSKRFEKARVLGANLGAKLLPAAFDRNGWCRRLARSIARLTARNI